jgi:hypothetical protein
MTAEREKRRGMGVPFCIPARVTIIGIAPPAAYAIGVRLLHSVSPAPKTLNRDLSVDESGSTNESLSFESSRIAMSSPHEGYYCK